MSHRIEEGSRDIDATNLLINVSPKNAATSGVGEMKYRHRQATHKRLLDHVCVAFHFISHYCASGTGSDAGTKQRTMMRLVYLGLGILKPYRQAMASAWRTRLGVRRRATPTAAITIQSNGNGKAKPKTPPHHHHQRQQHHPRTTYLWQQIRGYVGARPQVLLHQGGSRWPHPRAPAERQRTRGQCWCWSVCY